MENQSGKSIEHPKQVTGAGDRKPEGPPEDQKIVRPPLERGPKREASDAGDCLGYGMRWGSWVRRTRFIHTLRAEMQFGVNAQTGYFVREEEDRVHFLNRALN